MESAAVGVWVATGSRNENKRLSGISHFLEHMVFKGTPTRSMRKIKEDIEGRGGSLNGFTSEEVTCYLAKVSSHHIDIAIDVLSDMVLYAHLSKKDIERERNVIIEEIRMYRDLPSHYVHDILSGVMWPNHSLGLPISGDMQSVSSITRGDLVEYKNKNYTPKNIVVSLSGNFDGTKAMQNIKRLFRANVKHKTPSLIRFNRAQRVPQIKTLYKDTEQSHLVIGMHTFGKMHKDRYALGLLHIILGANMSSRLFESVREKKGLAYEIGTEIKRYKDTGAFLVNVGTEHKKVQKAVLLILKELKKIKTEGVSRNELKRAKEFFRVQLLLALEDTLNHMLWLGEYVLASGKLPDKNDIIKKIASVSSSDIERVAKDIFKRRNLNLALIGPVKDKERREIEATLDL